MMNLIYLMDRILFQTFKIILKTLLKKHETIADNLPIQMYGNKIKNEIIFKKKTGDKLELLPKETMKLLGSTKQVIDEGKNSEMYQN